MKPGRNHDYFLEGGLYCLARNAGGHCKFAIAVSKHGRPVIRRHHRDMMSFLVEIPPVVAENPGL